MSKSNRKNSPSLLPFENLARLDLFLDGMYIHFSSHWDERLHFTITPTISLIDLHKSFYGLEATYKSAILIIDSVIYQRPVLYSATNVRAINHTFVVNCYKHFRQNTFFFVETNLLVSLYLSYITFVILFQETATSGTRTHYTRIFEHFDLHFSI